LPTFCTGRLHLTPTRPGHRLAAHHPHLANTPRVTRAAHSQPAESSSPSAAERWSEHPAPNSCSRTTLGLGAVRDHSCRVTAIISMAPSDSACRSASAISAAGTTRSTMNRIRNWPRLPPVCEATLREGAGVFAMTDARSTPAPRVLPVMRGPRGAVLALGCEAGVRACVGLDERVRRAGGVCARGGFRRVGDTVRPRKAMPCRCTTRYSEDSPIPNRWRISDVGVLVSP
jgi:hypothetical protein